MNLHEHLQTMGFSYGDFPAHNGLWEMAERTSDDLLARLALVPRTLEARGLDAAPPIRDKLRRVGDERGAAILEIILGDEIGHVAIGNCWYRWLCDQHGLDPLACYAELAQRHRAPRLRGPFNLAAAGKRVSTSGNWRRCRPDKAIAQRTRNMDLAIAGRLRSG